MTTRALPLLLVALLPACFVPSVSTSGHQPGHMPADPSSAALDALRSKLEGYRTQAFPASVSEVEAQGDVIYFKTYPTIAPVLHRMSSTGTVIDYAFSIGDGDGANERASSSMVVTAEPLGDHITYHAYDALSAKGELGAIDFPAPTDNQKWWAYATSGTSAYVLTTPSAATGPLHTLWVSSHGAPQTEVGNLEDMGMNPGEIDDFDVDGQTMMLVEQGRLWRIDLAAKKATWLHNQTRVTGAVDFEPDAVVWEDAAGLEMFDLASMADRNVSAELQASSYMVGADYPNGHDFYSKTSGANFSRFGDWVIYTANLGIFAYDLKDHTVKPVLIDSDDSNGNRVDYAYPVATSSGKLYVVGLTSTDGAVGADGPVYETDLPTVLAL